MVAPLAGGRRRVTREAAAAMLKPVVGADLPEYLSAVALGRPQLAGRALSRLLTAGVGEGTVLFALSNLVGGALGGWARHRELSAALGRRRAAARAGPLARRDLPRRGGLEERPRRRGRGARAGDPGGLRRLSPSRAPRVPRDGLRAPGGPPGVTPGAPCRNLRRSESRRVPHPREETMSKHYPFAEVEPRWQAYWEEHRTFRAEEPLARSRSSTASTCSPTRPGAGLHVGPSRGLHRHRHRRALQAHARLQRAAPDGLGRLRPAGRAVRHQDRHAPGRSPRAQNIDNFRRQIEALGLLLRLGPRGRHHRPRLLPLDAVDLPQALRARPGLRGRGAGQLVPGAGHGAGQRGGHRRQERGRRPSRSMRRPMRQWMLQDHRLRRAPARRTSSGSTGPSRIKEMQRNWIGRSEGAEVRLRARGRRTASCAIFTTRPDTLFGATYMVLAPEHPLVAALTTPAQRAAVEAYQRGGRAQERPASAPSWPRRRPACSPAPTPSTRSTASSIPIWIADYVLDGLRHRRHHGRARRTTSATASSRAASSCPSARWSAGGDVERQAFVEIERGTMVNSATPDGRSRSTA